MLSRNSLIENFKQRLPQNYTITTTGSAVVIGLERLKEILKEIAENDLNNLPRASPAMKGRLPIRIFKYPGGNAVVRQAARGGFLRLLGKRFFSSRRFFNELLASEHLRRSGISTPQIIALKIQQDGKFCLPANWQAGLTAWIITELAPNAVSLREYIRSAEKDKCRIIFQKTAELLSEMHNARVVHPDFHIGNILVAKDEPILIDLDGAKSVGEVSSFWRAMNLARFIRSTEKMQALEEIRIPEENIKLVVDTYRAHNSAPFLTTFLTIFRALNYILFPFRKIIWR